MSASENVDQDLIRKDAGRKTVRGKRSGAVKFGGNALPLALVTFAIVAFLALTQPNFASYQNINSILFGVSIEFLAIIGFTYVMVMREIDLSVGSVFALTGTLTGALLINDWSLFTAAVVALGAAGLVGLLNGLLVVRFGINSLMLTIGTMLLVRGLSNVLANDLGGRTYPREFRSLARTDLRYSRHHRDYGGHGVACVGVPTAFRALPQNVFRRGKHEIRRRAWHPCGPDQGAGFRRERDDGGLGRNFHRQPGYPRGCTDGPWA